MGLKTISQANHVADLMSGGKIRNKKQRDSMGVSAGDCIEKYVKANVLNKMKMN